MSFTVSVKQIGETLERLQRQLKVLADNESHVRVGVLASGLGGNIHPSIQAGDDLTLAEIAAVHEFGSRDGKIPERSFIRAGVKDGQVEIASLLSKGIQSHITKNTPIEKVLSVVGEKVVVLVRAKITEGLEPQLKQSTESQRPPKFNKQGTRKLKRHHKPLLNTGALLRAIEYVVKMRTQ